MHNCVVVQTNKIEKDRYQTRLGKLLGIFEQDNFVDSEMTKYYHHLVDDENIRRITDILHYCASDANERKKIEAEIEAWETYQELSESTEKTICKKLNGRRKNLPKRMLLLLVNVLKKKHCLQNLLVSKPWD